MPKPSSTLDRVAFRPTAQDRRFLAIVAAHVQAKRQSPFVAPSDAIRAALEMTATAILKDTQAA